MRRRAGSWAITSPRVLKPHSNDPYVDTSCSAPRELSNALTTGLRAQPHHPPSSSPPSPPEPTQNLNPPQAAEKPQIRNHGLSPLLNRLSLPRPRHRYFPSVILLTPQLTSHQPQSSLGNPGSLLSAPPSISLSHHSPPTPKRGSPPRPSTSAPISPRATRARAWTTLQRLRSEISCVEGGSEGRWASMRRDGCIWSAC